MTVPATRPAPSACVADPVGTRLVDLSAAWDATCVLEDENGRVVSHAVAGAAPAGVIDAVVSRVAAPLHRAQGPATTLGVMSGGPVLSTTLTGWDGAVTIVPLARLGRLWVLHPGQLTLADCAPVAQGLVDVLERIGGRATDETLLDALYGKASRPLSEDTWVVAVASVEGPVPAADVHVALRHALPVRADITATNRLAFVVLRGVTQAALDMAVQQAGSRLGTDLAAVFSPTHRGLVAAREDAERALAARQVAGRCLSLADCRPYLTFPALLQALDAEPRLGGDPLADLDEGLVTTLMAWLDHFGDLPAAAGSLDVHRNTFRYRLNRAKQLVSVDLLDPIARIDLHLRLHSLAHSAEGTS